jgi:glycosyltransferase involved in cell wall biosynthesis
LSFRLLRVIPTMDPRAGGTVEAVRQGVHSLRPLGIETDVLCGDEAGAEWVRRAEFPVHAVGAGRLNYGYNRAMAFWLRDHCQAYSAVIVDGLWQYHAYATWRHVRGRVPYYVFAHGMLDPWFRREYPLKHLKKLAYWRLVEHRILRDARGVIFTCDEERKLARASFTPYKVRERTATLGISVPPVSELDASREVFLARYPQLRGKRTLLFLGRLHEKKGCDLLLDAFRAVAAEYPEAELVMAGPADNAFASTLRQRSAALPAVDRIHWTGMLQGRMKWGALRAADVFCLPSHQENFGLAVVEALAAGTPVLISDKVKIWPEVQAFGAGLVGTDTLAGATDLLRRWLARRSGGDRDAAARAASRCYSERFTPGIAGGELAAILRTQEP